MRAPALSAAAVGAPPRRLQDDAPSPSASDFCGQCPWQGDILCEARAQFLAREQGLTIEQARASLLDDCAADGGLPAATIPLEAFCGECLFADSFYGCDARVAFLMGSYDLSEEQAQQATLEQGHCIDPGYVPDKSSDESNDSGALSPGGASSSQLYIYSPSLQHPPEGYDHIEALFGVPPYGGSIAQNLYYAESQLCTFDPEEARRGYPLRPKDDEGEMLPWPSPFILMVDRGGCTFVQKVRNAQRHGAAAVIIADNACLCDAESAGECVSDPGWACETREPIMADDGSGSDITIPSFLMFKQDADVVKAEVRSNNQVQAKMSWSLPTADDRVEYELWTTPTDESSKDFLMEFKDAAVALGEHAYFTPQMFIYDGIKAGCQGLNGENDCYNLCTNSGRYCATDPDNDLNKGISGAAVVTESLRLMCIWRLYGQEDGIGVHWWNYVNNFLSRCDTEERFSEDQCISNAMGATKIIDTRIAQCMSDSGGLEGDTKNKILEEQLLAKEKGGVVTLPSLYVNGVLTRGSLEFSAAFQAICAGYAPGTAPSICTICAACDDMSACVSTGYCGSKPESNEESNNIFAPSPGDPSQPSYLHEIPPFIMVLGFPRDIDMSPSALKELEDITSAFLQDAFQEATGYVVALQAAEIAGSDLKSSINAPNITNVESEHGVGEDVHFIEVSGLVGIREAMDAESIEEFIAMSMGDAFQRRDDLLEQIQGSSSSALHSVSFVELSRSLDICPNALRCHHGSKCAISSGGFVCDCSVVPSHVYDAVDGLQCEFAATQICSTDTKARKFCVNGGECIETKQNASVSCSCDRSLVSWIAVAGGVGGAVCWKPVCGEDCSDYGGRSCAEYKTEEDCCDAMAGGEELCGANACPGEEPDPTDPDPEVEEPLPICNCPLPYEGARCQLLPKVLSTDASMNAAEEEESQSNSFPSAGDIAILVVMGVGLVLTAAILAYKVTRKTPLRRESKRSTSNEAPADINAPPNAPDEGTKEPGLSVPENTPAPARDEEAGLATAEAAEGNIEEEKEEIASIEEGDYPITQIEDTDAETTAVGDEPDSAASPK